MGLLVAGVFYLRTKNTWDFHAVPVAVPVTSFLRSDGEAGSMPPSTHRFEAPPWAF